MKISIINYGIKYRDASKLPDYLAREDAKIMAEAKSIIADLKMGKGAIAINQTVHTDLRNLNNRSYVKKGMPESIRSFYQPVLTPFLLHHDSGNGSPVVSLGTTVYAKFIERVTETKRGNASGYGKVAVFVPEHSQVNGTSTIDALIARQFLALSLGARVEDSNYRCSICGASRFDPNCNHIPGETYEGRVCCKLVYDPTFVEHSAVYGASDVDAMVARVEVSEADGTTIESQYDMDSMELDYTIYELKAPVYPSADIPTAEKEDLMAIRETIEECKERLASCESNIEAVGELVKQVVEQYSASLEAFMAAANEIRARESEPAGQQESETEQSSSEPADPPASDPTVAPEGSTPTGEPEQESTPGQPSGQSESSASPAPEPASSEVPAAETVNEQVKRAEFRKALAKKKMGLPHRVPSAMGIAKRK